MAQLSRPYQIGLAAIVLLAAVWLVLLQGHSSSPSSPASSAAVAPASTAPAATASTNVGSKSSSSTASKAASPSAPGMAGLTRAIEKAHGAATISQQTNAHLQEKSAQASSPSTTTTGAATNAAQAKAVTSTPTTTAAPSTAAAAPSTTKAAPAPNVASRVNSPTKERTVEAQLAHGKIALILFWNPKGADDQEIHRAVGQLHSKGIAVNEASASDIASFGTITRGIQVYATPTLLIVNKKGQTIVLTGPQDAFVVEQAISEARHP